ncbi:hypothetical protein RHGRI_029774 [Rhododendron griersonianum]|uniref:Uncharacterized protein n=1 Tax=Rhododendron griersonianum TaxID=479676 RepID=A0AAV6IMT5_9ERIC|nr:hypothetical protein RHGRI_029774 [Rhododendron griersonianum]
MEQRYLYASNEQFFKVILHMFKLCLDSYRLLQANNYLSLLYTRCIATCKARLSCPLWRSILIVSEIINVDERTKNCMHKFDQRFDHK